MALDLAEQTKGLSRRGPVNPHTAAPPFSRFAAGCELTHAHDFICSAREDPTGTVALQLSRHLGSEDWDAEMTERIPSPQANSHIRGHTYMRVRDHLDFPGHLGQPIRPN